jgi:hypothetical protein
VSFHGARRRYKADTMEENILTWNVANWITVILMAAIGFGLLGLAQKLYKSKVQANENS